MNPTSVRTTRLLSLLEYIEAAERDKLKVELDFLRLGGFKLLPNEALFLPGVHLSCEPDDDPKWLKVERLSKTYPPEPQNSELRKWLVLDDSVDYEPTLSRTLYDLASELSDQLASEKPGDSRMLVDQIEHEFRAWLSGPWAQWQSIEKQRRKTIELYGELYALQRKIEDAFDAPVEVVCGLGIATMMKEGNCLRYPLISKQLEISINLVDHSIELRARSEAELTLETEPLTRVGFAGLDQWIKESQSILDGVDEDDILPTRFSELYEVLKRAVSLLAPDGVLAQNSDADLSLKPPPSLVVIPSFCIFERQRSQTQLMEDLARFRTQIERSSEDNQLGVVDSLVCEPSEVAEDNELPIFRGITAVQGVTAPDNTQDLFFCKPFNQEQVRVVQELYTKPGVVVQGPPGTGKTHTIANIICHYLASGKRILVTSQKSHALRVLRQKLPIEIQPLAVSLLDSDRDGIRQFQDSVEIISEKLQGFRIDNYIQAADSLLKEVETLHREIALIDSQIDAIGSNSLNPLLVNGSPVHVTEAIDRICLNPDLAEWLSDEFDLSREQLLFSDSDIEMIREARKRLGELLPYFHEKLPTVEEFPSMDDVLAIHGRLLDLRNLDSVIQTGPRLKMSQSGNEVREKATALAKELDLLDLIESQVGSSHDYFERLLRALPYVDFPSLKSPLDKLKQSVTALQDDFRYFLLHPVELPMGCIDDPVFVEAVARQAEGKSAVSFPKALFLSELKQLLSKVTLNGDRIGSAKGWLDIRRYMHAQLEVRKCLAIWNGLAELGLGDRIEGDGLDKVSLLNARILAVDQALAYQDGRNLAIELASSIFQWNARLDSDDDFVQLKRIVRAYVDSANLREVLAEKQELISVFAGSSNSDCAHFTRYLLEFLGTPEFDVSQLSELWRTLRKLISELESRREDFEMLIRITTRIGDSGATTWASDLVHIPANGSEDPLLPSDWRERWNMRGLFCWLKRVNEQQPLERLMTRRRELEGNLENTYVKLVEVKAWLEVARNASNSVRSSLASYADAIRRIGKGTGKRAAKLRKEARQSADRAKSALPCWIMPHYRVSESLPAEFSMFDLVIVDEASQSTISSFPALLRAKKILIVGDDKQVSPELVGRDMERADELADKHLKNQVSEFIPALREDRSLYDLGKIVFAGSAIMLTEHFRCAPAIIEYSKGQFYGHRLNPLRVPNTSERLDPPLIDIYVPEGYRNGDINLPEAECIVSELEKLVHDPAYRDRSIGVTTLLGKNQASTIYNLITLRLGIETMIRHNIRVGDPSAFQGDEKDIMFVSMVAQPGDMALSGLRFEQRFNVAMSRSRDRLILVRSVRLDQLSANDMLRRSLLEHFKQPFPSEVYLSTGRRERCESGFERDMFDVLVDRGYLVDTQVRVGHFRIDIVVEGDQDRRLAVECDGDRYHGPDKWPDDMARQRLLERAGWTVWRCFASRFYLQRESVIEELVQILHTNGIEPRRLNPSFQTAFTEFREWRSPAVQSRDQGILQEF